MSFLFGGSDGPTAVVVSSNSNLLWTDFIPVFLILAGGVALLVLLHLLYQRSKSVTSHHKTAPAAFRGCCSTLRRKFAEKFLFLPEKSKKKQQNFLSRLYK